QCRALLLHKARQWAGAVQAAGNGQPAEHGEVGKKMQANPACSSKGQDIAQQRTVEEIDDEGATFDIAVALLLVGNEGLRRADVLTGCPRVEHAIGEMGGIA